MLVQFTKLSFAIRTLTRKAMTLIALKFTRKHTVIFYHKPNSIHNKIMP